MKEEQDKWIEKFRNRMNNYSESVPGHIWEQLDAELERPKGVPFYTRWRMVAAVAALLAVPSLTIWFIHSPSADYTENVSEQISRIAGDKLSVHQDPARMPDLIKERIKPSLPVPLSSSPMAVAAVSSENETTEGIVIEALQKKEAQEKMEAMEKKDTRQENKTGTSEGGKRIEDTPVRKVRNSGYSFTASPAGHRDKSWEVGISVGNVPASVSNTSPGYKSLPRPKSQSGEMMSDPSYSSFPVDDMDYNHVMSPVNGNSEAYVLNQILSNNVWNTVVSDIKHRMPITVGASVRLHLDERWACETGLTYTFLSSDIRAGGDSYYYETEQQLHYVGIPVKVSYNVWESNRFSFYISAGGTVEKCVSGKTKTVYTTGDEKNMSGSEDLKVKPLQWSVSSAVGAQFKLSRQIGIYAEPGVAYYFNDGSEVQTIRKEHPFNFNLQVGVRFSY